MVLAYHVIFSSYGFWLPNDPRGSNSNRVAAKHLWKFGSATKVGHRQSVAGARHDYQFRMLAKKSLKYPVVRFNGKQARAIARGFDVCLTRTGIALHACAILPDHVHLVVVRHSYRVEQVIALLKGAATKQLNIEGINPMTGYTRSNGSMPSPFGEGMRKVFLSTPEEIVSRINYVRNNPIKQGFKKQLWWFETPYKAP